MNASAILITVPQSLYPNSTCCCDAFVTLYLCDNKKDMGTKP